MDTARHRSSFLLACHGENHLRIPVWFMRQAGRYLEEYRELRSQHDFWTLCQTPKLAAQVSELPYRRFGVDAIIVFSDILLPLQGLGIRFHMTADGPKIEKPFTDVPNTNLMAIRKSFEQFEEFNPKNQAASILETLSLLRDKYPDVPLIGFSGAPFTLASYLIEGESNQNCPKTKVFRVVHREEWDSLMKGLSSLIIKYLQAQRDVGADVLQLFDSWVGTLPTTTYRKFVMPYVQRIIQALKPTPVILFAQAPHLLFPLRDTGAAVLSLDWRIPLEEARKTLGPGIGLQGNLDPAHLMCPPKILKSRVLKILENRRRDPAYIFNLGHGVLPQTPPESIQVVVDTVKSFEHY